MRRVASNKGERGRSRLVLPLILCVFVLVILIVREAGVSSALSSPYRTLVKLFTQQEVPPATPAPLLAVREGMQGIREVGDDEDIEKDGEISRDSVLSGASGSIEGQNYSGDGLTAARAKNPISEVIRSSELEGDSFEGVQYYGEEGIGQDFNFRDVLSSLEDEDDAIIASGRIFGVRVQNGVGGGDTSSSGATGPTTEVTPEPDEPVRPWVTGQSRGYTMLYAMHPRARAVVETQISTLLRSRVREPHIGVLIDGTFTKDFEYLRRIIDRLSADGRRLKLTLYLTNGPVMRRFETTEIVAPFSKIDPVRFRALIRNDAATREQVQRIVSDASRLFRYNLDVHPENSNVVVPMLEDNLDWDSYNRMKTLVQRPLERLGLLVRNPCRGCYEGNDGDPQGSPLEEHNLAYFPDLRTGDAFSFDGLGFAYPGKAREGREVSSDQLLQLMQSSAEKKLQYVGLWRDQWQGIRGGEELKPPNERDFIPSTREEQLFEIRALRLGLSEESPPPVPTLSSE